MSQAVSLLADCPISVWDSPESWRIAHDWLIDHDRERDAISLKVLAQGPVLFFIAHAGWYYRPDRETKEQGQLRCAWSLALAENWLQGQLHKVVWSIDEDTDRSWLEPDDDRNLWACSLWIFKDEEARHEEAFSYRHHRVPPSASLGGIDLGPHSEEQLYIRIVEAELALEVAPEEVFS